MAETEIAPERSSSSRRPLARYRFSSVFLIAIWFGIFAGLIEGSGLIFFQRVNWQNWGEMLHVAAPIIWISPVVDVVFFTALACLVSVIGTLIRKIPIITALIFLLSFLTAYDWLTVTGRLYHRSCFLLALGIASVFTRWAARNKAVVVKFLKRTAPGLVLAALIAFASIHWGSQWREQRELSRLPAAAPGSPNVVVIIVDTLRADHLSAYGYGRQTTPNIDRLAREGVLFENAISPSSWSLPSHASLLTGRYQFEHRVEDYPRIPVFGAGPELNGFRTLGEVFEQRGYRTAAFSANRVNVTANLGFWRGFSHFEDYFDSPADGFVRTLYGREFSRIYLNRTEHSKVKRLLRWLGFNSILDRSDEGSIKFVGALGLEKRAAVVNRELADWIDSGDRARPFFGFLNYIDVHHPYGGPPSFTKPWNSDGVIDQYDDGIKYVDDYVGELMRQLQTRGLAANTLVVVTSDHGESLGEHHIAFHGEALYREQVHVPLIFWFPGRIPAGVPVAALVSNASIPATLVSVLNMPAVADFRRPAIDVLWKDPQAKAPPEVPSEVAQLYPASDEDVASQKVVPVSMDGPIKSLITPRWQLMVHRKLGNQLYDYAQDPAEMTDLFRSSKSGEVSGALLLDLQDVVARPSAQPQQGESNTDVTKLRRMAASPGSVIEVELRPGHLSRDVEFRPVLSIFGADGKLFQTCRNPGDDNVPKPGVSDPTPQAFDDLCMNTTSTNAGSSLEILVPGAPGTPVELNIRASDWDGRTLPSDCEILANGAAVPN